MGDTLSVCTRSHYSISRETSRSHRQPIRNSSHYLYVESPVGSTYSQCELFLIDCLCDRDFAKDTHDCSVHFHVYHA